MDKNDGGIGTWPVLLLLLGIIGTATTQVSQRVTALAPSPGAVVSTTSETGQVPPAALLARLLGTSTPAANASAETLRKLLALARKESASRKISLKFLIATLPDYVDSNSGWNFDASLDAIQRAAGAAGFVLDRFVLPDWAPTADGIDPATGKQHELEPGLVLFRKVDEKTAATEILAVFVVTETPTAGIHEAAFLKAAQFVDAWQAQGNNEWDKEMRVLGPTFSGSSPSLRRAITTFLERAGRTTKAAKSAEAKTAAASAVGKISKVRVLSGTATSSANQELLTFNLPESGAATVKVSFSATVRTDEVMLQVLHDHLVETNRQWDGGNGVVLLVESNTGYGQGFAAQKAAEERADPGKGESDKAREAFPKALRIPFPIHISRLRAEAERLRAAEPRPVGTAPGSMFRDIGPATDQLPSMTPQITAAAIDTLVASILATIRREQYPAIGIFATDKRDHLFLAERIVREVPNALLFTTEADLIYVHPDFRSFVRGAIVATTYPLFNATQSLTTPHLASLGRQQFSTMAAQGMYNAVLMFLERDDLLLDYLSPGCIVAGPGTGLISISKPEQCFHPPVWISVVGRDGLWPIDYHPDKAEVTDDKPAKTDVEPAKTVSYTEAINETKLNRVRVSDPGGGQHINESGVAHSLLHVANWMWGGLALLLLALVAHMAAYLAVVGVGSRWSAIQRIRMWMGGVHERTRALPGTRILHGGRIDEPSLAHEFRLFLFIAVAILLFASVWALRLVNIRLDDSPILIPETLRDSSADSSNIWHLFYGGIFAVLFIESILAIRQRRAAVPQGWVPGTVVTSVALVLASIAAFNLVGFLGSPLWSGQLRAKLFFARTVNPGNWASPAVPLLALLGVLYVWTVWNIRQLKMGGWSYRRESQLFQVITGREPRLTDEVADIMVSPWRRQDWRCLVILPFGLFISFWLYVPRWYTPDGLSFDKFLWWGSLLTIFIIAHSLATTAHLWLLIRRILRHLHGHPIADSFTRVAEEPFDWQLSLTPPPAVELRPLVRKVRTLRFELRQVVGEAARGVASAVSGAEGKRRRASDLPVAPISVIDVDLANASECAPRRGRLEVAHTAEMVPAKTVAVALPGGDWRRSDANLPVADAAIGSDAADMVKSAACALMVRHQDVAPVVETLDTDLLAELDNEMQQGGIEPYFRSKTWSDLVTLSDRLVPVLRHGSWHRDRAKPQPEAERWYRDAEALVGMQTAFVLRDMLARLVSGMTITIGGCVLAFASHLFYSFPGRSAMLAFDWILVALAVTATAAMLIYLEKNPVLNRLWSKTPGRFIWTGGFVYRLGLYGAIPIITLFAWQFPEVGGRLFGWIEPLQKAIP